MRDYPLTLRENLLYRVEIINKCAKDEKFRSLIYERCSRDPIYWIDMFCWTHHSRDMKETIVPWICYECQIPAILALKEAIEEQHDILFEKTREMGVSWFVLYVLMWFSIFRAGSTFRTGSWKENYVDKIGDMDSHFEKIRFTVDRLPDWMIPQGVAA